ncbi:MAG: M48 family metallopeptidase [Trueperaceae bacterium]|nr:M48 family metallopeptidase [Trueperaceae bacterium]
MRASWLLGAGVVLMLVAIAYLVALALEPGAALFFVVIAVVVATGMTFAAYWFSDKMALAASGARAATREEHRYLVNVTEAVSLGAGVPVPRIFVIDSPAPNAFATGRDPKHGVVAVTTGLLDLLDRQELEGVVAHELAHIRNYDIRFASLLAATVGAVVLMRDVILRAMRFGGARGRGRSSGGGKGQALAMVALVVLLIVAPILATLLRMAVSRRREYLADATGAYITRNPEGLASALEKLRDFSGERLQVSEGVQHMFFVNPLAKRNAHGLFSTHPPIQERIDRLRRV